MSDYGLIPGGVTAAQGFTAGGVHCGIRKNHKKLDLMMLKSEVMCTAAAVYTQNKVYGAPITVTREHLCDGHAQAAICNSGNANTCNADGVPKARQTCEAAAQALGLQPSDIIIASTGVIGQPIDMAPILHGIEMLRGSLTEQGGHAAAQAIMTTDTVEKECAVEFTMGGKPVKLGAMAKGSGMIHPNMATMLVFITTDAAIAPAALSAALSAAVNDTLNMISVDGDTSTNDMACILANGLAQNAPVEQPQGADYEAFCGALLCVLQKLSRMLARDGEGATKLLECVVTEAPTKETARIVAKSIITSSLVKSAMFGEDANWGRILCAIGYAPAQFEIESIAVKLCSAAGEVTVCEHGAGVPFSEEFAAKVLAEDEIRIAVSLGQGSESACAWGCDLTYDYVKINGDYRT